jgi:hypothetical protein
MDKKSHDSILSKVDKTIKIDGMNEVEFKKREDKEK